MALDIHRPHVSRHSPETLDGYRSNLDRYALPALGRFKLADLRPADIRRLVADLNRRGLSRNTIRLAVAPLRLCLSQAARDSVIARDPSAGLVILGMERAASNGR